MEISKYFFWNLYYGMSANCYYYQYCRLPASGGLSVVGCQLSVSPAESRRLKEEPASPKAGCWLLVVSC
jgi:hypothetical protein